MSWTMVVPEKRLQSRVAGLGQVATPAASARLFEDIEKFQPFRMVEEIRDAVQEGREAVGEMRVHLGGLSPTLKAAMVVTAVSTGWTSWA